MSGSSTLRICLAAMAPALTEAASARLKLQDTSAKNESLSILKLDKKTDDNSHSVLQRPGPVSSGDSNALGGRKRSEGDRRVTHLSFTDTDYNRIHHTDPKRSALTSDNTRSKCVSIAPGVSAHTTPFPGLKSLNLSKGSHLDSYYVSEDFQGGLTSRQTHKFIDNLKIMNQPQTAADQHIEPSIVDSHPDNVKNGGREEVKTITHCTKIKIKPPVMVNGDNELQRTKENEELQVKDCDERGDAPGRRGSGLSEVRSVQFTSSTTQSDTVKSADKMGMCVKNDKRSSQSLMESTSKSDSQIEDKSKEDMRKDCIKKQAHLERRVETMLRRLKRVKGKVVESHTREELRKFVNFQHKNLQNVAKSIKKETPGPEELKEHFLSNEEVKNMSTTQLVKLVKTYQSRAFSISENPSVKMGLISGSAVIMEPLVRNQSLKTAERLSQKVQSAAAELDSDATASSSGGESGDEDSIQPPQHPADLPPLLKRAEWIWAVERAGVVGRWTWLQAQVSDLEYRIRQQSQVYRQLRNSKGGVVLGDQPSTVEILRRLQALHPKQIGGVPGSDGKTLPEGSPGNEVSPCNVSAVMSNVDRQASRLTQSLGNCLSPASPAIASPAGSSKISSPFVSGLTDSPSSSSTTETDTSENSPAYPTELRLSGKTSDLLENNPQVDATCQAARCRPLRSYRKRKILKTIGLYKTGLKAARLSDVRCRCYPPDNPCPMCGGRYNNTVTVDSDTMSFNERVAVLNPSFHPVLSFRQDIHLPIHCEGLLKSGMWQNKPPPRRSRVGEYRRQKVITLVTEPVRKNGNNRQNGRNNNSTSVINFSAKIKNKYESKTKGKATASKGTSIKPRVNKAKRKAAKMAREALKKNQPEEDDDEFEALFLEQEGGPHITRDSGLSCSASQSSLKDMRDGHQRKRKVDNSFDINNIVIPLSMAASTRVEQPQYKEIVTPKWRELPDSTTVEPESVEVSITKKLEKTNGVTIPVEQHKIELMKEDEEEEDLSDEKFASRHLKVELEEKKRFRNFVQYPPLRRNRARSDAAGTTLPLPDSKLSGMEKPGMEGEGILGLQSLNEENSMSSRPSTPVMNRGTHSYSVEDSMDALQHQLSVRRRTMSFSKRERSSSVVLNDEIHNSLIDFGGVEPWPRRTFPLSEEEYQLMREDLPPSCEPVHQRVTRRLAEPSGKVYVGGSTDNPEDASAAPSPHPSNESVSSADDPADPEWVGGDAQKRSRNRRTINDDPNDPEWTGSDTFRKGKNKR